MKLGIVGYLVNKTNTALQKNKVLTLVCKGIEFLPQTLIF